MMNLLELVSDYNRNMTTLLLATTATATASASANTSAYPFLQIPTNFEQLLQIIIIPLCLFLYNQINFTNMVKFISSSAFYLGMALIMPTILLLSLDLLLYIARLSIATASAFTLTKPTVKLTGKKKKRTTAAATSSSKQQIPQQKLHHSNSYFNFNNYIKRTARQYVPKDRKNSSDSLNSNDSIFDYQERTTTSSDNHQHQQPQQQNYFQPPIPSFLESRTRSGSAGKLYMKPSPSSSQQQHLRTNSGNDKKNNNIIGSNTTGLSSTTNYHSAAAEQRKRNVIFAVSP